ncbi:unnamed protein product [Arabis nemorensis]|uniref:Uncharacterized protein n=1 Tax=Arabis nemorensis TaxID=586526 RepID=A0A565C331_9BRAS|nr:unnamed protein product [Arabis nemorensis]
MFNGDFIGLWAFGIGAGLTIAAPTTVRFMVNGMVRIEGMHVFITLTRAVRDGQPPAPDLAQEVASA